MILGRKVLRVGVCFLGAFTGSLRAQVHDCERELLPIVDPEIVGLEFQRVNLYEHSYDTGLTARVVNRSPKTIVAVYAAFEAYSRSGEYLLSFSTIASSDKGHSKLAIQDIPEGIDPGETGLAKNFHPGNETNIHADSALSLATCDVTVKVSRLWLEFEDHSVLAAQGNDWSSDALPKGKEEVHKPPPKECRDRMFSLTVSSEGKATAEGIGADCEGLKSMLESAQFKPALRRGKPTTKTYKVLLRRDDETTGMGDQDFGSAEALAVVIISEPKCANGIYASWGTQDVIYAPTEMNVPGCLGAPAVNE